MKDGKLTDLISTLPESAALAGIRAHILQQGLDGNLKDAAQAFEQLGQCAGHEGLLAELTEFLVARYAFRGDVEGARKFYARFDRLGASGAVLQAQAAGLHILACTLMDVKLEAAIDLWLDYVQRQIPACFKKISARTGLMALRAAIRNSDSRQAGLVFSALCALARETGDAGIEARAQEIFGKGTARKRGELIRDWRL